MKKIILFLCLMVFAANIYAVWDKARTDAFITQLERAADPDNVGKSVKSVEMTIESLLTPFNVKMDSKFFYKAPDKLKSVSKTAGMQTITVYFNGKQGIKDDSLGGVSPIEGVPLEEIKMQAIRMNPAVSMRQIFHKIEIADELEEQDGRKYVAMTCYFNPSSKLFPQKYLVDPDTKLIAYSFSKSNTELGVVEVVSHNIEHRKCGGFVIPVRFTQTMMKIQIECKIVNFEINKNYPDSMFEYQEK